MSKQAAELIKSKIRTVPHWPKEGVMFRDITTLIADTEGLNEMMDLLYERYKEMDIKAVVGIEARGFITGSILAYKLGVGFTPIRKKGKLPGDVIAEEYSLEYGTDKIEMQTDALKKGDKVVLVDDLIATGGTAVAACRLLNKMGAEIVECSFIVDLPDLKGKQKLEAEGHKVFSLVEFEGE